MHLHLTTRWVALLPLLLCLFTACAAGTETVRVLPPTNAQSVDRVRAHASEDLRCPAGALRIERPAGLWRASGCGWQQQYALVCGTDVVKKPGAPGDLEARRPALPVAAVPTGADVVAPRRVCGYTGVRPSRAGTYPFPPDLQSPTEVQCHVLATGDVRGCWSSNARGLLASDLLEFAYSSRFTPLQIEGVAVEWLHTFRFRIDTKTGAVVGLIPDAQGTWQPLSVVSGAR